MVSSATLRRVPQQARGQRRVSQILDAAAEVFAEIGFEAATTNAIAVRANTSIGSLYQFFPNKEAILSALAERYTEQLRELLNPEKPENARKPLSVLVGELIDNLEGFYLSNPGFRPLFYGSHHSAQITAAAEDMRGQIIRCAEDIIIRYMPTLEDNQRHLYAAVIVTTIRALLSLTETSGRVEHTQVVEETKRIVLAYVASSIGFDDRPRIEA